MKDLTNTFDFFGFIENVLIPVVVESRGKSKLVRKIRVSNIDPAGRYSSCIMTVPMRFDNERLLEMKKRKMLAYFKFNIQVPHKEATTANNILNLSRIIPLKKEDFEFRQELKTCPYKRFDDAKIDERGYKFPYDY